MVLPVGVITVTKSVFSSFIQIWKSSFWKNIFRLQNIKNAFLEHCFFTDEFSKCYFMRFWSRNVILWYFNFVVELKKTTLATFLLRGFQISTTKAQSFHVAKISCVKLLGYSVQCSVKIWLYVIIMSHTSFRVNQETPCSKLAPYLKFKWQQRDSNPQPLCSLTNTQPLRLRVRLRNKWLWVRISFLSVRIYSWFSSF